MGCYHESVLCRFPQQIPLGTGLTWPFSRSIAPGRNRFLSVPMSRVPSYPYRFLLGVVLGLGMIAALIAQSSSSMRPNPAQEKKIDPERSAAAFRQLATVLRHPRCMNCHTATNFPRVGDDRHRHDQFVQRGPDDHGVFAMQCATCHQDINQQANGVPGAPGWALAPLSMAWEGLDDGQLADHLKDPKRNGSRALDDLYEHMANDELVGWAWKPGGSRKPPPMPREEFARLVREWIDTGAVSPK